MVYLVIFGFAAAPCYKQQISTVMQLEKLCKDFYDKMALVRSQNL